MMSSKACNILAPLFIGQATQQLVTKGEVPWVYLFLYFLATCDLSNGERFREIGPTIEGLHEKRILG